MQSLIQWAMEGLTPGVRRPCKREIDHSFPSSVEVKSEWSVQLIRLHGVHKNIFTDLLFSYSSKFVTYKHRYSHSRKVCNQKSKEYLSGFCRDVYGPCPRPDSRIFHAWFAIYTHETEKYRKISHSRKKLS